MVIMSHLKGSLQICKYTNRSPATIFGRNGWVKSLNFPAKMISDGIWESDTDLIDEWRKDQILNGDTVARPALKKVVKRGKGKK